MRPRPFPPRRTGRARVLVGGLKPARRLLVPLHRRARERQPHRPHHHRPARKRPAPGQFRLRQLPERQRRQAQRLSPDDFEDERAVPAEQLGFVLHLGDFIYEVVEYPGRGEVALRPHHLRRRAHPRWRQVQQLPLPADARGLSGRLQRLSGRPRPAGCPRPLAIRRHVGQPRILVAGMAEHPAGRRPAAARAKHQGRRESGVV